MLDPRLGFGSSHWKESEKQPAKVLFIRKVKKLAIAQINVQISVVSSVSSEDSCHDNEDDAKSVNTQETSIRLRQSKGSILSIANQNRVLNIQ